MKTTPLRGGTIALRLIITKTSSDPRIILDFMMFMVRKKRTLEQSTPETFIEN